jgi:hypothetical protein
MMVRPGDNGQGLEATSLSCIYLCLLSEGTVHNERQWDILGSSQYGGPFRIFKRGRPCFGVERYPLAETVSPRVGATNDQPYPPFVSSTC